MTLKFYDDGSGNSYTAMGVPGQLSTSNVTSSSADLTLPTGVPGAQYYELSESTDGGSTWTVVDSAIAPSSIVSPATYSRTGLTSGVTYQWRLRARFASLVSPLYSAVRSAVTAVSGNSPALPGSPILFDGFESGDMSTTNANGFLWEANNRTSIVTMQSGTGVAIYNNGVINNVDTSGADWTAYDGSNSLRFRYPGPYNQFAEQRFDFGIAHKEIWVSFWMRVPFNFQQPLSPVGGSTSTNTNNKLLRLWQDSYMSTTASKVGMEFRPDGNGGSVFYPMYNDSSDMPAIGPYGASSTWKQFITYPSDQGRWMQIVFHAKCESSLGATDGAMDVWRRWDGGASFSHEYAISNIGIQVNTGSGPQGFAFGYLLGEANSGYNAVTEFLIDDVAFYTFSPF